MNVTFDYLDEFERRAKVLAKKYKSFEDDYNAFLDYLEENPFSGTPLGSSMYKHRMSISSKGKGKSGGTRVRQRQKRWHKGNYLQRKTDRK